MATTGRLYIGGDIYAVGCCTCIWVLPSSLGICHVVWGDGIIILFGDGISILLVIYVRWFGVMVIASSVVRWYRGMVFAFSLLIFKMVSSWLYVNCVKVSASSSVIC